MPICKLIPTYIGQTAVETKDRVNWGRFWSNFLVTMRAVIYDIIDEDKGFCFLVNIFFHVYCIDWSEFSLLGYHNSRPGFGWHFPANLAFVYLLSSSHGCIFMFMPKEICIRRLGYLDVGPTWVHAHWVDWNKIVMGWVKRRPTTPVCN